MDRPAKPKILMIANISAVPDNLLQRLHMFEIVTTTKTTDFDILNKEIVTVIDDFKHIIMIDTAVLKLAQVAISLGKWHRENPDGAFIIGGGISMFCFNVDRCKRLFRALDLNWCVGGITDCESVLHLTPGKFPPTQWPSALPGPAFYLNNVASADKRYISRTTNDLYAAVAHRGTVMWLGFSCVHQGYTELALSLITRCVEGDCNNSSENGWHELVAQQKSLELGACPSMDVTEKADVKDSSDFAGAKEGSAPQESDATVKDDVQSAHQYQHRPMDALRLMDMPATCFNFDNDQGTQIAKSDHTEDENDYDDQYDYYGYDSPYDEFDEMQRFLEKQEAEGFYDVHHSDTEGEVIDQEDDENGENTDNVEEGEEFGFGIVDTEKESKPSGGAEIAVANSSGAW